MQRTLFKATRQLLALALALGLVVATAAPSAAGCLKRNDETILCVGR